MTYLVNIYNPEDWYNLGIGISIGICGVVVVVVVTYFVGKR